MFAKEPHDAHRMRDGGASIVKEAKVLRACSISGSVKKSEKNY
jgi:hypothetical protein